MKIFLIHAKAGQGHQKAAEALFDELQKRDPDKSWDIRLIDALDHTYPVFGRNYGASYFFLVKHAVWLWELCYHLSDHWIPWPWVKILRSWINGFFARPLENLFKRENPDLILTTHFLAAESASRLKRRGSISSRVVVVVTDFLVHRFWINDGADAYIAMMEETRKDLIRQGVADGKIYEFGIPVSARFLLPVDTEKLRKELGLEKGRFTILVTSGSFGSGPMREFVGKMESLKDKVQVIVVCGINQRLKEELSQFKASFPCAVLGFVNNMHELMSVSDLVVSRSSGLTTCESLVKGLAMVIISKIPGQETHNAEILLKHEAAFELSNPDEFDGLVASIIRDPARLKSVLANVARLARPQAASDIADFVLAGLKP